MSETFVSSALYGPIIDSNGNVQGAIQILNKENDCEVFDEAYTDEFESLWGAIGSAIWNAHTTLNIMALSYRMSQILNKVPKPCIIL